MSRKNELLPVIIGHLPDGQSDKCVVACRKEASVVVAICRMKPGAEKHCGDEVQTCDYQNIISEMWFCREESLQAYINALQDVLDKWKEETECEK